MGRKRTRSVDDVGSQAWKDFRLRVLARDGYVCLNCGKGPLTGKGEAHVDHITPRALGGRSTMENCRTLCRRCNLLLGRATAALVAFHRFTQVRPEAAPRALAVVPDEPGPRGRTLTTAMELVQLPAWTPTPVEASEAPEPTVCERHGPACGLERHSEAL